MTERLHLVAHIASRGLLLDASQVDSVIDVGDIVPAPGSAPAIRGLAALRSRVVTVIDTWKLLDLPPPQGQPRRAAVTQVDGHCYAVLVDALEDVAPFAVQPLASGVALGACWADVATGSADRAGEPMLAIDLHRLVDAVSKPAG
ncbi:chemotaxis protein CheW [Sphingomonas sp. SUN019]|uniref:chemotaxis protein CheW n=1 Tax=Sphingomonas sp. SUN019 TaxID=2937788 RepID=UPI002164BF31|nr:chemotaxis protein CheW [Sphingomonas sp. SUN019]UVO52213.1 chemotaxis protein CheW [Sphingomonas sp. SUN019]